MAGETPRPRTNLGAFLRGLSARRRLTLGLALAAALGGFYYLISRGDAVDLQPLFTRLDTDDAAALVEELRSAHVPYELAAGGTAVLVPGARLHELRLDMAAKGLPRGGGVGFEIFDRQTFGTSDFVQQLNYRRALMGELARTISQLDSVESARVHIVMPERSLYSDRDEAARASVTVRLRPGRRLGRGQVDAVVHLVSSSVEGLTADQVTVVDTSGAILSRGDGQEGTASALEVRRQIEDSLEKRVAGILEHAVGPGRAVVQVAADVDFSQTEKTAESFDPDGAVVRSEQSTEERGAAPAAGVGGPAGVRAALAGETGTPKAGGASGSLRRTETRNYEVSKSTSRETVPSGKIQRLQVAVLLDDGKGADGKPLDDAALGKLTGLVQRAVGFDAKRGDQVEIQKVHFAPQAEVGPAPAGPSVLSRATSFVPHLLTLAGLAVLLVFVLALRRTPVAEPALGGLPRTVRELESQLRAPALPGEPAPPALLASRAAEEDHARAASVLRGWLGE
jgi:flagellar M-ring protein FliF